MSERYNVAASAVLGENYKVTSIECSDYNPSIDGNITVTITVNDVYGDAISGESVTVTASEGTFTQLNGSDITAASSVAGTTNSSGQFTLTYNCSEWGVITFTANNKTVQCNVTGFKKIAENITYKLYVDESQRIAQVRGNRSGVTIGAGDGFNYNDFKISSKYRPSENSMTLIARGNYDIISYVWSDGTVGIYNNGSQKTSYNFSFIHEWHY